MSEAIDHDKMKLRENIFHYAKQDISIVYKLENNNDEFVEQQYINTSKSLNKLFKERQRYAKVYLQFVQFDNLEHKQNIEEIIKRINTKISSILGL